MGERGNNPSERNFYEIYFGCRGYNGVNYIEFERIDLKSWRTSEIGIGYTTTCSKLPEWLSNILNDFQWEKKKVNPNDGKVQMEYINYMVEQYDARGKILGVDVLVKHIYRRHENGEGNYYQFDFFSKEEADIFSNFLFKEEKKNNISLVDLRSNDDTLFYWHQLYLIDPKYELLSAFIRETHDEDFLKYNNISYWNLKYAVQKYLELVIDKIYQLTDGKVEEAKKSKHQSISVNDLSLIMYLRDARYKAISWEMLDELLRNYEEGIVNLAKEKRHS